jgi:cysteine desulfurase
MNLPIYLDYAASTPVDPRVAEAMSSCLTSDGVFANPASRSHIYGWQAEEKVETARRNLAELLGCDPREIIWTSGATESSNIALKGVFEAVDFKGHLITAATEHKCVLDTAKWLQKKGVEVTFLAPDQQGRISVQQVRQTLRENTRLVSVMHANNETGVINPVAEIGQICADSNVLFHVDAAQTVAKLAIDLQQLPIDFLSVSAHKFYGPKGIGALYVRRPCQQQFSPQTHGGGQERGLRPGTLPTHQIVGLGEAALIAKQCLTEEAAAIAVLRDQLWRGIGNLPGVSRNGGAEQVLPGHLNICFAGVDGETLLLSLRELAVSTGSACASASMDPSYVLTAMGLSDEDANSSIRFSIGRFTQSEQITSAVVHIRAIYTQLQQTANAV